MMIIIQQIKHIPIKQLKQNIFKLVWRDCSVKIGNLEYNTPSVEPSIKKYLTLRRLLNEKKTRLYKNVFVNHCWRLF